MQGIGILLGALMTVIVLAAFKQDILLNPHYYLDIVWRLVIAIGCIPESTSACK